METHLPCDERAEAFKRKRNAFSDWTDLGRWSMYAGSIGGPTSRRFPSTGMMGIYGNIWELDSGNHQGPYGLTVMLCYFQVIELLLVGGLEYLLFSTIWDNPSHWLYNNIFSRWFKTTNQIVFSPVEAPSHWGWSCRYWSSILSCQAVQMRVVLSITKRSGLT